MREYESLTIDQDGTAHGDDLPHALASTLNRFSAENASNTPDFILAQYLLWCLAAWNQAVQQRETWYGRDAIRYRRALESIAASSCCDNCQEAALVARVALRQLGPDCPLCHAPMTWTAEAPIPGAPIVARCLSSQCAPMGSVDGSPMCMNPGIKTPSTQQPW